ncbi:MAG TPA: hypothetical protein VFN66_05280, partial [Burkholderiales bacterium]|nr:hypothetical protein [Burkholderiales bacterium]
MKTQADTESFLNLAAFEAVDLNTSPYEYLLMTGFIRPEAIPAVSRDFPDVNQAGSFPVDTMHCGDAFIA